MFGVKHSHGPSIWPHSQLRWQAGSGCLLRRSYGPLVLCARRVNSSPVRPQCDLLRQAHSAARWRRHEFVENIPVSGRASRFGYRVRQRAERHCNATGPKRDHTCRIRNECKYRVRARRTLLPPRPAARRSLGLWGTCFSWPGALYRPGLLWQAGKPLGLVVVSGTLS